MNNWQKYNLHVNDWDSLVKIKFIENTGHGTFCDVGACNGVMTSFFKDLAGNEGMVYSFELNPYNYNNIKHLASNNCIMENMGVSDSPGVVSIYSDNTNPGNHISNIIGHDTAFRQMNIIGEIKSTSLDDYFDGKDINYIKIDVEGAELKVINGGLKTISKSKYCLIECHFQDQWGKIAQTLNDNGLHFNNLLDDSPITPDNYCYQIYRKN